MMPSSTHKPAIALIAALDRNFAIGRDGEIPWHLPDDLKRFKQLTLGKPILMGRKTAVAIGRALPGRLNLVLTRSGSTPFADQEAVASINAAIARANGDDLMVIGGGEVYSLALPHATRLNLTWIDTAAENADAHFPHFGLRQWRETARVHHPVNATHAFAFDFVDYERITEIR
jgi:dihydrofolate reductase